MNPVSLIFIGAAVTVSLSWPVVRTVCCSSRPCFGMVRGRRSPVAVGISRLPIYNYTSFFSKQHVKIPEIRPLFCTKKQNQTRSNCAFFRHSHYFAVFSSKHAVKSAKTPLPHQQKNASKNTAFPQPMKAAPVRVSTGGRNLSITSILCRSSCADSNRNRAAIHRNRGVYLGLIP